MDANLHRIYEKGSIISHNYKLLSTPLISAKKIHLLQIHKNCQLRSNKTGYILKPLVLAQSSFPFHMVALLTRSEINQNVILIKFKQQARTRRCKNNQSCKFVHF